MTSLGPQLAGTGTDSSASGTVSWSSASNINANDNAVAQCAFGSGSGAVSHELVSSGHDFSSVPADATSIDGIQLDIAISASTTNRCTDTGVWMTKDGSTHSPTNAGTSTNVTGTETLRTYGGSTSLWGTTWTAADVRASTFGGILQLTQGLGATTAKVDYMQITVWYTGGTVGGGGGVANSLMLMGYGT